MTLSFCWSRPGVLRAATPRNGLVPALVLAPLGIAFGHVALRQIKRTGDDGRGLAVAGLVIGYAVTVLLGLFLILVVVYFAVLFSQI